MKYHFVITKISLKLIFTVGIVTVAIISVYSYLSIQAQGNDLLSQAELSANKLSETLKNSMNSSMLLNKQEQTHAIINASSEEPCILEIRIFNKEGRIMYSSQKDAMGKMVNKKAESCYACHTADEPI